MIKVVSITESLISGYDAFVETKSGKHYSWKEDKNSLFILIDTYE